MSHDGATGARRNETERSEPINDQFAAYVQSSAFSLSLGRTHIRALSRLAVKDPIWGTSPTSMSPQALLGLERRGLVTHHRYEGEPPPFGDSNVWELTTAGKLVALLLVEAGLLPPIMTPFPPPPPGWTDPRPKIKPVRHDDGSFDWITAPSERELANRD